MHADPTVHLVDDEPEVLDYVQSLLDSVGLRYETYRTADSFLESYEAHSPECLVLDIRMPGMSGLELQRRLRAQGATLPIVFLTGHSDVAMAVQAMKEGALDYIEKPCHSQVLLDTIQLALERDRAEMRKRELRDRMNGRLDSLTAREREVLELVVAGYPSKSIAASLNLSKKTIDLHRAHIMKKMEAQSVAELVRNALIPDLDRE